MKKLIIFCLMCITSTVWAIGEADQDNIKNAVKKALPSVVSISVNKISNSGASDKYFGSGVIINKDGYIVTNAHVIENASVIEIEFYNNKKERAELTGIDEFTDLAVLKVSRGNISNIKPIDFTDSTNLIQGQVVIAIGNPLGFGHSVTMGIVSALNRNIVGSNGYNKMIQTDAAINPGNSGGALINAQGRLVGINTSIISSNGGNMGIGFAVPSNVVKEVTNEIIKKGFVERGWVGISYQPLTKEFADRFKIKNKIGAVVSDVIKESPADKAGLKIGDIIISYDNQKLNDLNKLYSFFKELKPGKKVILTVERNGKIIKLEIEPIVKAEKEKKNLPKKDNIAKLGIITKDISEKNAYLYGITVKAGAVIFSVLENSAAYKYGLRNGDVILKIENEKVINSNDFYRIMSEMKNYKSIMFLIRRRNSQFFVIVDLDK